MISECSKWNLRSTRLGWKLCKISKFCHTKNWYLRKQKPVQDNELYTILWDSKIKTDHLIPENNVNSQKKEKDFAIKWILSFKRITDWK